MKVVYKKTIIEQMDDAISEAKAQGKKIEKFVMNKQEFYEFLGSRKYSYVLYLEKSYSPFCYYSNILVECVE